MHPREIRNLGITAHIDSGKTTLAERILYYTGRIRRIHEVRGADGVGATMDSMRQEQLRGISIQAAATSCRWLGHHLNVIDTPGHMDFTVEVERSLRVLDGAALLLCAVGGVQAQTLTVSRQLDRYEIPRIAFVNKCDRPGADPLAVVQAMRRRLGLPAVLVQLPLFENGAFTGVIDLITQRALRFAGEQGEEVLASEIPPEHTSAVASARAELLDAASLHCDALLAALVEGLPIDEGQLHSAIRAGVLARGLVPVLVGSAYQDIGVQPLLDAIVRYLPSPLDRVALAAGPDGEGEALESDPDGEPAGLVFKVQETQHGSLSWLRVYRGRIAPGTVLSRVEAGQRLRVGRLVRLHAGQLEGCAEAAAGDIVALFGANCASGDTLTGGSALRLSPMRVPEPVVEVAARLVSGKPEKLSRAVAAYLREDPSLRAWTDPESGELRLKGMGELHLEIYVDRLLSEHGCAVELGPPQVALRLTVRRRADFDLLHRKQSGGPGQYARIRGFIEPSGDDANDFAWRVVGGEIPAVYREAIRRSALETLASGFEHPVTGARVVVTGGAIHSNDSSEHAFATAARAALKECFEAADPVILEPVMRVEVEADEIHSGAVLRTLLSRRGQVLGTSAQDGRARVEAAVPLAELFGYATALRSATAGGGAFAMELHRYAPRSPLSSSA